MTWARDQTVGGGTTKLILMLLGDYADDDGHCWPGIETIAEKAEVDERTVRRHLSKLERMGKLERSRRRRRDGTLGGYDYQLLMGSPDAANRPVDEGTSGQTAPAGRLSGGDVESPESADTTGGNPHEQEAAERPTSGHPDPPGRLSGGRNGASGGATEPESPSSTGQSVHDHRTNEVRTTGQDVRTEPSREQLVGPSPPAEGVSETELEQFLGEDHPAALDAIRSLPGFSERVEETFVRRFVTGPTGELLLKGVPEEYRPAVIAECIWQYLEPIEGDPPARWNGSRFGGWLRSTAGQARKNVAAAVAATPIGEPDEEGVRHLEGGGVELPDGRRLTEAQARALRRMKSRMENRRTA